MDEQDQVFERLRRVPMRHVLDLLYDAGLIIFDHQTQKVSLLICNQSRDICSQCDWDIEELIENYEK